MWIISRFSSLIFFHFFPLRSAPAWNWLIKQKKGVVNWHKWICISNRAQIGKRNNSMEWRKKLCYLKLDPFSAYKFPSFVLHFSFVEKQGAKGINKYQRTWQNESYKLFSANFGAEKRKKGLQKDFGRISNILLVKSFCDSWKVILCICLFWRNK